MIEDTLKKALDNIHSRHFNVENPQVRVINKNFYNLKYSKTRTEPENNFVAYLVAHYLIELDGEAHGEADDLTIFPQIQLYKQILNKQENKNLISDFKLNEGIYPDVVFHKGQNDNNPENQKIAIECKINEKLSYNEFSKDLAKLLIYILEINFQKSIYIIVNNEKSLIEDYLKCFKSKYNSFQGALNNVEIWIKNYNKKLEIINFC